MAINQLHNTYHRKGYRIEHYIQRSLKGYTHVLTVYDQGAKCIPTVRRLLSALVPRKGFYPIVSEVKGTVTGVHSIRYTFSVRYLRTGEKEARYDLGQD